MANPSPESPLILNGDAIGHLGNLPDRSISLVLTSPPYNAKRVEYERHQPLDDYLAGYHPVIDELVRVMTDDGSLCWQVGTYVDQGEALPLDAFFIPMFRERGLKLRNRIIWHFGHGKHCERRFSGRYETLLWFTKGDDYTFNLDAVRVPSKYPGKCDHRPGPNYGKPTGNPLGKNPSDVWELMRREWETGVWEIPNVNGNHREKTGHPCQFPIELAERCILALTNPGDWVLDCFAGSGTTLLAALMRDRRAIGCERDARYVNIIKHRITSWQAGDLPYRPLGQPIRKLKPHWKDCVRPIAV